MQRFAARRARVEQALAGSVFHVEVVPAVRFDHEWVSSLGPTQQLALEVVAGGADGEVGSETRILNSPVRGRQERRELSIVDGTVEIRVRRSAQRGEQLVTEDTALK